MNATTENTQSTTTYDRPARRELRRSTDDRMLAGVVGGLARYLDVDATLLRIVFVALTVMGGAGVPIYLAAWLLIPEDGAGQSIAASFLDSRRNR
jgi:phage shock protein PspC (stress-responsive transcriptional regulator)